MFVIVLYVAIVIVCGIVGSRKGRTFGGVMLGLFLSLIGLVILLALPPKEGSELAQKKS